MGQVVPCCELSTSATRSSIDGRATPSSEIFYEKKSTETLQSTWKQGEAEDVSDPFDSTWKSADVQQAVKSDRSVTFETRFDANGSKSQGPPIAAVKAFVKALVRGYPSTLLSEGEQKSCVMILDKAIRKLAVYAGKVSKNDCLHEIPLAFVQDIETRDVMSFGETAPATKQHKAEIRWFPQDEMPQHRDHPEPHHSNVFVVSVLFATQGERDLFAGTFSTLCRQVQALDKAEREATQEKEPGEVVEEHESGMFHTTPAKFVSFGNASISEVTAVPFDVLGLSKTLLGQKGLNPNQGTLQKTKDVLASRPWKPPSLVLQT